MMINEERIAAYINSLDRGLSPQLYELEKEAVKAEVPIIGKETQRVIRFLLTLIKPKRILEVGTAVGFSALFMSEHSPADCMITTIEKVPMRLAEARKNLKDERFPDRGKITLKEGEALGILRELAAAGEKYDFIFLDAAKGQYMNFLPELMKLLVPEGILVTDNVLQDGTVINSKFSITRRDRTIHMRMREYLYTITHMDELETLILLVGDGIAVSYRKPA